MIFEVMLELVLLYIASYFFKNGIKPSLDVATALAYGLKIDTAHLSRGVSELDIDMFSLLLKLASTAKLPQFEINSLKISDLDSYHGAISHLKVFDNIAIANIGNNCSEALHGIGDGGGHSDMAAGFIPNVKDETIAKELVS